VHQSGKIELIILGCLGNHHREMKWLPGMTQEKYDNEIKEALKIIKDFNIN